MILLNIIGAGRVGRTLGRLWREARVFGIGAVLTRSADSAREAVTMMGSGVPYTALAEMPPANIWLLSTPDGEIERACAALAASGKLRPADVVFHCSGALASTVLAAASASGAHVASVHPLKSFADARSAAQSFAGTYCAAEGDAAALAVLKHAFTAVGGRVVDIDAQHKTLYHAASVLVCNKLTALMEAGLRCYEAAGLERETATRMMAPLVRETVENIFRLGTARALTGPVARGDVAVVEKQLQALKERDPRLAEIYRSLGLLATELAQTQGGQHTEELVHTFTHSLVHRPGN